MSAVEQLLLRSFLPNISTFQEFSFVSYNLLATDITPTFIYELNFVMKTTHDNVPPGARAASSRLYTVHYGNRALVTVLTVAGKPWTAHWCPLAMRRLNWFFFQFNLNYNDLIKEKIKIHAMRISNKCFWVISNDIKYAEMRKQLNKKKKNSRT